MRYWGDKLRENAELYNEEETLVGCCRLLAGLVIYESLRENEGES